MGTSTLDQARQTETADHRESGSASGVSSARSPAPGFLWKCLAVSVAFLVFLASLSDVRSVSPASAYVHANETFLHGYLEQSQREADHGYTRFHSSRPEWARKFLLLEATAMVWRGLNTDILRLFAEDQIPWPLPDEHVERLTLEARALTGLHRFPEAEQQLKLADGLCAETCPSYGALLRAHAKFLLEKGQMDGATQALLASQRLARANGDAMLESTALLTLGYIASQQERHDEALEHYRAAYRTAASLNAKDIEQRAVGNEGWEEYSLGNSEKALELFAQAKKQAVALGDIGTEIDWLTAAAAVYRTTGQLDLSEKTDLEAIKLASRIDRKQNIINASMDLAQVYVDMGRPDEADKYAKQALAMEMETGSQLDLQDVHLIEGQAAMLRSDWPRAEAMLHEVSAAADSQPSMRWTAQRALANIREAQGDASGADQAYRSALALVEGARSDLKQEESRLTFLAKAAHIYDDYIHFLVTEGKTQEALEAADWSRARTLQQGLGLIASGASTAPPKFNAVDISRKSNSTLLFYWLGKRQSYLWAAGGGKLVLVPLPKATEITPMIDRYRQALLDLKDPLQDGNKDGRALYQMLVAPAANLIAPNGRVVILADGPMSQMNFETLVAESPSPHYWIEDATLLSAPSIRLFAAAKPADNVGGKLLLLGDSISPGPDYPDLPMAALEMEKVRSHSSPSSEAVFSREQATPAAYLKSGPEQFSYIHFVSHGTASSIDPLDSAVILSRAGTGEDSYKLYARDILRHPINANLVTISACNSSGTRAVAGEGLVGLSWAFLRAGAHNAIGSLWEVGDASTPQLMDRMYSGLQQGKQPADALREAKLAQIHSQDRVRKPFYWAPFQLYAGR